MPRVLRAGQHFSVWITIDGVPAEIYGLVGPNYVNGVPRTTGWIASEAGKTFVVHTRETRVGWRPKYIRSNIEFDGVLVYQRVWQRYHDANDDVSCLDMGDGLRYICFQPIQTTDDDDAADPVDQHLGEISVMFDLVDQVQQDDIELHSDSTVEQEDEVHSSDGEKDQEESDHSPSPAVQAEDVNRSSPPIQITSSVIHEKAKKAGSHYIQVGPRADEQGAVEPGMYVTRKGEKPKAEFILRYRPLEMLQAMGILPSRSPSPDLDTDKKKQDDQLLIKHEDLDTEAMWAILKSGDHHIEDKDTAASFPMDEDPQVVEADSAPVVQAPIQEENTNADVRITAVEQHWPEVGPNMDNDDNELQYTDDLPAPAINLASVASDLKIIVPLSTSTPQVGQEFAPEMSTAQVPPISRWALSPERLNTVDAREAVADGAEETATKRSHPHLRADRPEVQLDGCSRGLALGSSSAIHTRTGNRPFAGHVAIKRESPTSTRKFKQEDEPGFDNGRKFPGPSSRAPVSPKRRAFCQSGTGYQKRVKVEEEDESEALRVVKHNLRKLAVEKERLEAKMRFELADIQLERIKQEDRMDKLLSKQPERTRYAIPNYHTDKDGSIVIDDD